MVMIDELGTMYFPPHDGIILQRYLRRAGLSSRAAARRLEIKEPQLRAYYAGPDVPQYVLLALKCLVRERIEKEVGEVVHGDDFARWEAFRRKVERQRTKQRPKRKRSKSQ